MQFLTHVLKEQHISNDTTNILLLNTFVTPGFP